MQFCLTASSTLKASNALKGSKYVSPEVQALLFLIHEKLLWVCILADMKQMKLTVNALLTLAHHLPSFTHCRRFSHNLFSSAF